jgi:predicted nucleic acid-binding protein
VTEAVFVDTSALYAILDSDDEHHREAAEGWNRLLDLIAERTAEGVTHGSVLVEASALVQRRLGMPATRALHDDLVPVLSTHWVDGSLHSRAVTALLAANSRDISLVDWTSFELMRQHTITDALAFDDDFTRQGFALWR